MESLENAEHKWHPEIQRHAPTVPVVLVGLKSDLRSSEEMKEKEVQFVEESEAKKVSEQIGSAG